MFAGQLVHDFALALGLVQALQPQVTHTPAPKFNVRHGGRTGTANAPSSVTRYGPHTTGPLSKDVAATFRGGSYSQVKLGQNTTLYRVYGGSSRKMGPYWTRVKPGGPLQSQLDSALAPQWRNTAQNVVKIQVPKGTVIFEGAAAPQSTGVGQLLGGGNQVYIPKVDPAWIVP